MRGSFFFFVVPVPVLELTEALLLFTPPRLTVVVVVDDDDLPAVEVEDLSSAPLLAGDFGGNVDDEVLPPALDDVVVDFNVLDFDFNPVGVVVEDPPADLTLLALLFDVVVAVVRLAFFAAMLERDIRGVYLYEYLLSPPTSLLEVLIKRHAIVRQGRRQNYKFTFVPSLAPLPPPNSAARA